MLDEEAVKKMTMAQLKEDELKKRKLTVNGVKSILQERLLAFLNNPNSSNLLQRPTAAAEGHNLMSAGFAEAAIWK